MVLKFGPNNLGRTVLHTQCKIQSLLSEQKPGFDTKNIPYRMFAISILEFVLLFGAHNVTDDPSRILIKNV